ncbi:MAG TPA: hypothetical protein VGI45_12555 [Terracidiphilus sp.]|jgi:hypothetical protein
MNDLQAKFAITLVAFALFFAYAAPAMKQAKQDHDTVIGHVGQVYIAPNPNDPKAPSGKLSIDDLQKYDDQKAAERKAMALQ